MNQGIAFARTIRALEADDFRTSKLALLGVAVLLAAWVWWSLGARIPQYEATANVQVAADRAIAYFPAGAGSRIQVGQAGIVHTDGAVIPAQVTGVASDAGNGQVRVDLRLLSGHQPQAAGPGEARSVELEVARISPAALALRTLGRANP